MQFELIDVEVPVFIAFWFKIYFIFRDQFYERFTFVVPVSTHTMEIIYSVKIHGLNPCHNIYTISNGTDFQLDAASCDDRIRHDKCQRKENNKAHENCSSKRRQTFIERRYSPYL